MPPNPQDKCPLHDHLEQEIKLVRAKQDQQPCATHEERLRAHGKDIGALEVRDTEQWAAINQLRKVVWGWSPLFAALGAGLGSFLVSYLFKGR